MPSVQASDTNASATLCDALFLLRFYRRRWFGAKFAVSDFAACVCDVAAGAQRDRSEQYDCNRERDARFRPAQRNDDGCRAQCCDHIKEVNQFLTAILVLVEPCMTIVIGHSQDTIVSFFAKLVDRPRGNRGDEYEN